MEGEDQRLKNGTEEAEQNSVDFFVNNELENPLPVNKKPGATTREKVNTTLVIIVAVLAVFLGYYQLSYNINHPFNYLATGQSLDAAANCPNGNCDLREQLAAILAEQNKDTDGDGLPDMQEISVYKSSPFLQDSDSDGISDGDEVKRGEDPNCPQGQNCFTSGGSEATSSVPTFTLLPTTGQIEITPTAIRDALRQSGFSDDYLSLFTDADMILLYQEVLNSEQSMTETATGLGLDLNNLPTSTATATVQINTASLNSATANLNINTVDDLKNLSGAQIRQLMIQSGAPESVLSQVSDDELKTIFLEKLNAQEGTATQ